MPRGTEEETVTAQIEGLIHWVPLLGVNVTYCERPLRDGMVLIGHPSAETNENWCEQCAAGVKSPERPHRRLLDGAGVE